MNEANETGAYQPGGARVADGDEAVAALPKQIGRYRLDRVLGKGGFGLVYLAHDEQLQRFVAIKVPHAKLVATTTNVDAYLTEARTVANLDHPHIVPVFDVGSTPDCPCFVVSKYIDGTDLATRLKQSRLALHEAVALVATVAEALHHAHKQGLVHRDIKPGNILLQGRAGDVHPPVPFVGDFGLALREQDVGKGPRYAGTPAYMSPEQARGEGHRVDGRSDIFSLGVVFYELLVGRQPFRADSQAELLQQVTSFEVRPPRQYDDGIPKELERICLKALAKRASERYTTAKDLADDLRHFLAEQTTANAAAGERRGVSPTWPAHPEAGPPPTSAAPPLTSAAPLPTSGLRLDARLAPTSDQQLIKVIPKGLRSFDAHDADFFLELLPGPRDRDGLPDSLRFWKTRIEETDAVNTFAVGLLCGPSGCGKSSLVKAGLLPRLSDHVLAVYLEATANETEARLLNGLRNRCPALPANLGVAETLAALRRGQGLPAGKKVLIVLDQFEQWLHAKSQEENTDLVQALRQCAGSRVQCVVMVRDDFWMAVIRFMRALEIRLVEGQNSAAVDRFDLDHARKVLAAFGRAFGKLPENAGAMSKEHKEFLQQAVTGLAQEGKVVSVRVALFAEMMKGKAWTPASLRAVGGTEGVGITFLEETFSAATAPPEHRYHQKAARADLRILLPESGSDIKGHMRSYAELLEASGYGNRPKDFDDLLRILDNEVRLITPTDPEGHDEASVEASARRDRADRADRADSTSGLRLDARYYQLTHDYLVHSLREWLTRKQKETRRGRAELVLADRAAVWHARPENRQLPSLLQWAQLRWLTAKKTWTPPQRQMMAKAGRYHAVRCVLVAVLLAAATFTGLALRERVEEQRNATHADGLVQSLLNAETAQTPVITAAMSKYRPWVDPLLREADNDAAATPRQKLHASLALLPIDPRQVDYLYRRLLEAEPQEVPVIRAALALHQEALVDKLWAVVVAPARGKEAQRLRAAAALANYDPDSTKWTTAQTAVVDDLVAVPAVYLSLWIDALRPVRTKLIPRLSAVFGNAARRETERSLATDILAAYAADQPEELAELAMTANPAQFAILYPKLKAQSHKVQPMFVAEIDKWVQAVAATDKVIFDTQGVIVAADAKVKDMAAKRYEVRLQGGKTYRLTMNSKDVDSFLVLQDTAGKELAVDDDGGDNLNSLLRYTPAAAGTYVVFAASLKEADSALKGTGSFHLRIVEMMHGDRDDVKEKLAKRQANAAVALLKMGQAEKVWPLLKHSPDPRGRSYLIHRFGPLGADAGTIMQRLEDEPDVTIRRALILSLGDFPEKELSPEARQAATKKLQAIYRMEADPGLHGAAEWLLRTWQEEAWLKRVTAEWVRDKAKGERWWVAGKKANAPAIQPAPPAAPRWYVTGQGQTMVVIPGPVEFMMGSPSTEADRSSGEEQHKRKIGRSFALASTPVTKEQFLRFRPTFAHSQIERYPTPSCPIGGVVWYEAAAYCNWLSEEEGIPEEQWCYDIKQNPAKLKANYLGLSGYRLPTEAEMEYATRAGALTSRYFGETEELLPKYAWYLKNSAERTWPVGSKKPNDLGLFDVQGNVFTWCQEASRSYPAANGDEGVEDKEGRLVVNSTAGRVERGGSFSSRASSVRAAYRSAGMPAARVSSVGFRLARTVAP